MNGSRCVRFLFVSILAAVVWVAGCGSSVNSATPRCEEGEEQVGNKCQPASDPKPDVECAVNKDCDDGSECTTDDRCVNSVCFYGDACDDGDSETEDACTNSKTGACSHTPIGDTSSTSTSSGGGPCVPETNADGSTKVVFSVALGSAQAVTAKFTNDWNGGWPNAVTYTGQTDVTIQGMMLPGVRILNAAFNDGYLVEGLPSVHLSVAESDVAVSFGGCPAVTPEQLSNGEVFPGYSVRYAWRSGEQGANLLFCQSGTSCAVSVY